jgi:hypothetical protein
MSRTEEYALEQMTRSMGRAEQMDQRRAMERACDTATLRAIVADNRVSVHLPADPAAKVIPADAGRVATGTDGAKWGWVDPVPLDRKSWAEMTRAEIEERDRREKAAKGPL